jgi:hypothetical protein
VSGHTVWLKTLNLALMGGTPQHIPSISRCFRFTFILFFVLVFCFPGTSVLEFKFGGNALSQTYFGQFLHLPGKIFPCYTHIGDNV